MTHTLDTGPDLTAAEVCASMLAFASATGPVWGSAMRPERDDLAGLICSRPLAELLRSDRPIVVTWQADGVYQVRDV